MTASSNADYGSCACDLTLNSCDVYCCCDQDCSAPILAFWNSNADAYCKRKQGSSSNKECIDSRHVFNYQKRMGMEVTQSGDQLCFSIDSESTFSAYQDIISDFDEAKIDALANKYSFRDVLYTPSSSGSRN